ncbi:peptidoglycan DD-metalloendopeptidase family protein [uncultured Mesotoga sp.]|uniref:peptidoglycan DD-metalloendopeptidase family protein n=1 Tax=Mesotoga sp. TaxID=2053577 RepID=UPI0025996A3F|nr:peptidoglycan DD-metalloendopeptidase family protein [uncultured Mesotoga sp.]
MRKSALLLLLVLIMVFFTGCDFPFITRDDFTQRMDALEQKIDSLAAGQKKLAQLEDAVEELAFRINFVQAIEPTYAGYEELEAVRAELQIIKNMLAESVIDSASSAAIVKTLYDKIDGVLTSTVENNIITREIDDLNRKVQALESLNSSRYSELVQRISEIGTYDSSIDEAKYEELLQRIEEIKSAEVVVVQQESDEDDRRYEELVNKVEELAARTDISVLDSAKYDSLARRLAELEQTVGSSVIDSEVFNELVSRIDEMDSRTRELADNLQTIERQEEPEEKNFVTMATFLGEISDIRSRLGAAAYETIEPTSHVSYIVKSGDNLWSIAQAYGVTVEQLKAMNPEIKNWDLIYRGDEIKIPLSLDNLMAKASIATHFGLNLGVDFLVDSIESNFGSYDYGYANPGMDLTVPPGSRITAFLPGKVILSERVNDLYGEMVVVDHGNNMKTVYARLGSRMVMKGDFVRVGDTIGSASDAKGNLHFEFWKADVPVNPADIIFENVGTFEVTMYTEWDDAKNPTSPSFKMTASGDFVKGYRTVAADPVVIPLGSIVYIPFFSSSPNKGFFVVEDTGSSIKGNKIDVYTHDFDTASNFKEDLLVYVVKKP